MKEYTLETIFLFCFLVLLAVCFVLAFQADNLRTEAVKHGCAEWVIAPNGTTTFKWK